LTVLLLTLQRLSATSTAHAAHAARAMTAGFVVLLCVLFLAACTEQEASIPETDPLDASIDQLRALGYVGYTDTVVKPGDETVRVFDSENVAPGFTLICTGELALAELYDVHGKVVHSWRGPGKVWSNTELLANGDLLVVVRGENALMRLSWDGSVVWKSAIGAHHDVDLTPAGTLAALTKRVHRIPAISEEYDVKDNGISLLTQGGKVLASVSLVDLLSSDPALFRFQRVERQDLAGASIIDLLHANSIEFMQREDLTSRHPLYALANVLVSIRHQDTIAIFDWSERKLVWAWGQGELSGQHDATVLESGNILIFDNGLDRGWSRIVELDPVAKKIVWEYAAAKPVEFFSLRKGSSQRLSNGNTLVANSDSGEAFELTRSGEIVWHFWNPNADAEGNRATIVRAKRYRGAWLESLIVRP
jgi:hypothetical protein